MAAIEIGSRLRSLPTQLAPVFRIGIVLPALIGIFHFWLMSRLSVGDFFNSYPYISDDGFDWILQGLAFNQLIAGQDASNWIVLRSPGFVLLNAVDDLLGSRGSVVMLAQSAAVACLCALFMRVADERGYGRFLTILLAFVPYLSISGYLHMWVLSDTIASALMAWGTYLALRAVNKQSDPGMEGMLFGNWRVWILPVLLVSAAGLTQLYGLIPLLVIATLHAAGGILGLFLQPNWRLSLIAAAAGSVFVFGGGFIWSRLIPHETVPVQFGLLALNFNMTEFYKNVWATTLLILGPVFVIAAGHKFRNKLPLTFEQFALFSVCCTFAAVSFIYQWADIRFTFIYLPIAWLFILTFGDHSADVRQASGSPDASWNYTVGGVRAAVAITALISLTLGAAFTPQNYWEPRLSEIRIAADETWLMKALEEKPRDRFNLIAECPDREVVCADSRYDEPWSSYTQKTFKEYRRRALAEQDGFE